MTPEILALLLTDIKNYLDITWLDEAVEMKLSGIISRGVKFIDHHAGATLDYTVENNPRSLLFDYSRYAYSNSLDEFSKNYLPEILDLQITESVKAYEASIAVI